MGEGDYLFKTADYLKDDYRSQDEGMWSSETSFSWLSGASDADFHGKLPNGQVFDSAYQSEWASNAGQFSVDRPTYDMFNLTADKFQNRTESDSVIILCDGNNNQDGELFVSFANATNYHKNTGATKEGDVDKTPLRQKTNYRSDVDESAYLSTYTTESGGMVALEAILTFPPVRPENIPIQNQDPWQTFPRLLGSAAIDPLCVARQREICI